MACKIEFTNDGRINKVLAENNQLSKLFQEIFNVPILTLQESIDIYKNTFSAKVKENKVKKLPKGIIESVFEQNKELVNIGTQEEYENYLQSIFPASKLQEVLYHGSKNENLQTFDRKEIGKYVETNRVRNGFYFTPNRDQATLFGKVYHAILDTRNPFITNKISDSYLNQNINGDAFLGSYNSGEHDYIVYSPDQIHLLGSESDTESFRNWKNSEDILTFETPSGDKYFSYLEALQNTPVGSIQFKVNDVTIAQVDSDTNLKTFEGSLNYLTKQGVLTGTRELDVNGDIITITAGETETAKQLTADSVETISRKLLGESSVKRLNTGDFIFTNNLNKRIINGELVDEKAVNEMNYEQLKQNFGEEKALEIQVEREFEKQLLPSTVKRRIDEDTEIKTEDELVRTIKTTLNQLGVKITSFEDYIKNNKLKNGDVPATSSALMDVVNKVMAFRDGTVTREDLIEETMHLIEASLDPQITEPIRRVIHTTPEWKEHSQTYYEIYAKEYAGDKLEEMVRREILGKVMANGVATNFALSEDATLTQQSIFDRIKEFLQGFFDKVNAYFSENTQRQIDELNKDIYVKLMSGDLVNELNTEQNFGTKFRLYSASKNISNDLVQIQKQAELALTVLDAQRYNIAKNDASQAQMLRNTRESLGRVSEQFEELEKTTDIIDKAKLEKIAKQELIAAFSYITNVAQKQLTYLQRAVKRNSQNNYHFSSEESAVYSTMISQFDKYILPAAKKTLEDKNDRNKAEDRILEEINKTISEVNKLKGSVATLERKSKDIIVDLLVRRLDLSEDKRQFIQNKIDGMQGETNFFFLNFGTLMHSQNIYLNTVGHVITKTDQEKRDGTLRDTQPFIKRLKDVGYLNAKVKNFAKDGFIENRFNDKARESAIQQARYDIYKDISGENITKEEFDKLNSLPNLTTEQTVEFNQRVQDWQLDNFTLSALSPSEMRERREKLASYNPITQNYERNSSLAYNNIMQNAEIVDGVPVFNSEMRYDFEQLKKLRTYDKSVFNLEGEKKDGIEYRTQAEYEQSLNNEEETDIIKISNGLYVSLIPGTTDNSSILAFELSKIDNSRILALKSNTETREFSPEFIEMLSKMDSKEGYDFLTLNAYIGYTNDYYETFNRQSIIDRLSDELGGDNDWKIQDLIEKISTTTRKLNTILAANRTMNQPSEINYDGMEKNSEVPYIKEYSEDLESYYSQASALVAERGEEIEEDSLSETIPNKAFRSYMIDKHSVADLLYDKETFDEDDISDIDKIFSEIVDHSTLKNKQRILELRSFVRDYSAGKINKIPKSYQRTFTGDYSEMSEEQVFAAMTNELLQYGYTRLLPYFRKSQPTGVDKALFDLEAGIIKPAQFMENYFKGDYPFLNISPNYNFQRANETNNKNPHFNQAKVQGTPLFRTFEIETTEEDVKTKSVDQLSNEGKLNKFVNKEFLKEYNIDLVHLFNTGEEIARANEKKFEARQAFVDLQKKTLENYGMINSHNLYLLPQKEKDTFRKLEDVINKEGGFRAIFDEIINFREDQANLGQTASGVAARNFGANTIPKFGLRKLSEGEASDELLSSYLWINRESNLFKARSTNIGDMLAVKEALLGAEFENNLNVESTNVYKMFEDAMKFNFYGVKENFSKEFQVFGKTADWGKILKSFGNFIRFRNLAFNVTIPITSALTGSTQLRLEQLAGERVDRSALSRANKIFRKTAGDSMRETMGFEGSSWLSAMGVKWGWFESEDRYNNSNYGKLVRGLGRGAFIAHTAANFPINSRVGLSVLSDHRFVDGKLIQYRDFAEQNKEKSDKERRVIWDTYTDVNQVSLVDESGVPYYDYKKIADALNNDITEEQAETFMKDKEALIFGRIKAAIQAVDQQISPTDRSIASRNSIFSFLAIHRGWLTLAAQNRFKGRQFSAVSGRIEEGVYRTAFRYINEIITDAKSGKAVNALKYLKDKWQSSDDITRRNLLRTMTEITFLNMLVGLVVLAGKELGDDDEDSQAFKLTSLFLMRTTNEIASSTTAIPQSLYGVLTNAVVGLNVLDTAFDIGDLTSDELVSKGQYANMTKRQRYLIKHLPGVKDYQSLFGNIDSTINSYKYFNFEQNPGSLDYFTWYKLLEESSK